MTTITIERTILDRLIEAWDSTVLPTHRDGMMQERMEDLRAELAKPVGAEPVACMVETESGVMVWPIADYNEASTYCDDGESPSLLYLHPPTPAWHDAPETLALKAERDALKKDAERYRYLRGQPHWSEALEKAIDAAVAKAEGGTE